MKSTSGGSETLKVSGLSASYGPVPVLRDVNLEVSDSEILALLGRNGVGKTTLTRVLAGLLKPSSGRIELHGTDITRIPPHRIAHLGLGYVPQGRGIFSKLTVRENLLIGTRARPDGRQMIPDEIYSYFPILKLRLKQLGGTLSGGEQQILAFGRLLCGKPKMVVLDEPSEGIQPSIVHQLGELILQINRTGIAVLLIEQNLDLALSVATRCAVMEKGTIVHQAAPEEFRDEAVQQRFLAI